MIRPHGHGASWRDAWHANLLIRFTTEVVPEPGYRTQLSAVLAEAETMEIRQSIPDALRKADRKLFPELMLWTGSGLHASRIVRDPLVTHEDRQYIQRVYNDRFATEQEMRSFEILTHIDVDKLPGAFDVKGHEKLLLQHIREKKWYLSERRRTESPLYEAAEDWYRQVFKQVCRIFHQYGLLKFFPENTASTLYNKIMERKNFMSERKRKEVGPVAAPEDYLNRFATYDPLQRTITSIVGP